VPGGQIVGRTGTHVVGPEGWAQEIAVGHVAAEALERCHLVPSLDTGGGHEEPQGLTHADDGPDDDGVIAAAVDVSDQTPVDFQGFDGQTFQVGEGGVSRPEVVDGGRGPATTRGARRSPPLRPRSVARSS
jgi:hypothetical protein